MDHLWLGVDHWICRGTIAALQIQWSAPYLLAPRTDKNSFYKGGLLLYLYTPMTSLRMRFVLLVLYRKLLSRVGPVNELSVEHLCSCSQPQISHFG